MIELGLGHTELRGNRTLAMAGAIDRIGELHMERLDRHNSAAPLSQARWDPPAPQGGCVIDPGPKGTGTGGKGSHHDFFSLFIRDD